MWTQIFLVLLASAAETEDQEIWIALCKASFSEGATSGAGWTCADRCEEIITSGSCDSYDVEILEEAVQCIYLQSGSTCYPEGTMGWDDVSHFLSLNADDVYNHCTEVTQYYKNYSEHRGLICSYTCWRFLSGGGLDCTSTSKFEDIDSFIACYEQMYPQCRLPKTTTSQAN
eukprot:Blabericola_migrator_1__4985@NODE_2590_length_2566_cov_83_555822_g1622_i0_p3_GENE_NODE_2590_length_2566_cov_83_555822_g1622_i0NODE_2590_length_2566_cov_83_555822_g1622_i0_p3_ORF_typecomplete_len172_score11_42_NODE_2590_length_2566_cov_83_555822_g1622_i0265780